MGQHAQRERITRYTLDTYSTEAEYLWADSPDSAVFRHPVSKKWFAILMTVLPGRLGLPGGEPADIMNVKCGAIMAGSLLSTEGFLPAYHMNKNHWISILLDGSLPDDQIYPLLELSYHSVAPRGRKRSSPPAEDPSASPRSPAL